MNNSITLPYLPDELWLQIFSRLRPADWCHSIPFVCRRWRKLASDPWLWRRVDFAHNLGWMEFPVEFLKAKLPLVFHGREDEIGISSSRNSQEDVSTSHEMAPGFMHPSCFVKGLGKLNLAMPSISALRFPNVRLMADQRDCTCSFGHGMEKYRNREDVIAQEANAIVTALAGFKQLRHLSLSIEIELAGMMLSLSHSDSNAAKMMKYLKTFDLAVGVW